MTVSKRLLDVLLALILGIILLVPIGVVGILCLILQGRPVLFLSERMHSPDRAFRLVKFRTMRSSATDSGASGGNKSDRITHLGHILRRTRLDELPQLWNILRGDMSFVGPRPPLRDFVERYPEIYNQVLMNRPGVTGLASLYYHAHEEKLLRHSQSAAETDVIYTRRCVPRKARLDLIYQKHQSICFDIVLIAKTAMQPFRRR
ncbi:sugar transferase [Aestuariibius sp. HNIBRBA575]|uniref:sugar transferase n=1 Tax=Aestuariibius sp. HNIBRBA575 TaxID=3233343 RepID=UPI0034A1D240